MTRSIGLAAVVAIVLAAPAIAAEATAPEDVAINDDLAVENSLTGESGDPAAGAIKAVDRKLGNCLACHAVSKLSSEPFHGNVGPTLDGAGDRWTPEQIRAIVVNSKAVFGDQTIMPGFYTLDVGVDVAEPFQGKTILSAQDVEDVVAFVSTLKE
jgi:sulfur-oxidizing protein SoxX